MRRASEGKPNQLLKRERELRGWSQADVAEKIGGDPKTVGRWERGITSPGPQLCQKLCELFGKNTEELGLFLDHPDLLTPPTFPCVFLASSYADAEHRLVLSLKTDLQARGVTVWSSRQINRHSTENRRKALQEAIRATQAVLLIVSPEARSSRHVQETLQLARTYQRPVCAAWIAGEQWQECFPRNDAELYTTIDARKGHHPSLLHEITIALEQVSLASYQTVPSLLALNNVAELQIEPRNPYKGLNAFRQEDCHDFFGRDTLIDKLTATLNTSLLAEQQRSQGSRLLAVVGPSGSGKSSVVMAGLLPRLQAGGLPGSESWTFLDPIVPGRHPIKSLARVLAEHLPERSLKAIREDLEDDSARGLHLLATSLVKRRGTRVVLLVDQFEELFTQTTSEEERRCFIDLLLTAITEPRGPLIVILTLRADFYDRPIQYPELAQFIQNHHQLVLPMDLTDLRAVIEHPAALPDVQLTFEGDLVGNLLFEVQGQVGALPLLQFTLDQLFQRRNGQQLTLQAYDEIGRVKGALSQKGESTYAALPSEEHRQLARTLFLRLIDPGTTEQETTLRRAALSELSLVDPTQTRLLQETAEAFIAARLLTTGQVAGKPIIEVSHEALIREWTRMADWLSAAREDLPFQQTMSQDAAEWERRGKPAARLYRGSQLAEARECAKRNMPSRNEAAFLRASLVRRRRYQASVITILLLLLSATGLASWFLLQPPPNLTLVTTLNDSGPGSLRQAVILARPGSTITFDASVRGSIILKSDDLNMTKNLTIRGPGAHLLTISSGNSSHGVLVFREASVTISDLTVALSGQNFKSQGTTYHSKLSNYGTLSLTNSTVSGITAAGGGNIFNAKGGTLTLTNSTVSGSSYGGIKNDGTLTLINSTISGNRTSGDGGGISNNTSGTLTITNSTIVGNTSGQRGGGISNQGILTITNSTISGNRASGDGGGINNNTSGTLTITITYSTIVGNMSGQRGGGLAVLGRQVDITFCTIYGNTATGDGGGLAIENGHHNKPSQVTMRNSLVAGNAAPIGPEITRHLTSDGYNLIQDSSGVTFADPLKQHRTDVSVQNLTDVKIDLLLRNNGGPTPTLALLPGSPAIDRIPLKACLLNTIGTDQRGVKRPQGATCDIGAYEYEPSQ